MCWGWFAPHCMTHMRTSRGYWLCMDTHLEGCLETEKTGKLFFFFNFWGGDLAVREDTLPLIPWRQPLLCWEVEAVAKKLHELAMNFPHGSDRKSALEGYSTHYSHNLSGQAVRAVLQLLLCRICGMYCLNSKKSRCTFFMLWQQCMCYIIISIKAKL